MFKRLSICLCLFFIRSGESYKLCSNIRLSSQLKLSNTLSSEILSSEHESYLKDIALINPPARLQTLLTLLQARGDEIVSPRKRASLNPFLIPLAKCSDGTMVCYMRWPTQKADMDLQIVKTTEAGIKLLALGTDQLCKRLVVEMDFYSKPNTDEAISLLNSNGNIYTKGDYLPLLKSGKFPILTEKDLYLVLVRFLLTKVSAFPDCYEALAHDYLDRGDVTSALVTCERSVSVFYGWGQPIATHAMMLSKLPGRSKEARDTARAALSNPLWVVADTLKDIDELAVVAGFTGAAILGEMHAYRAKDPRTDEIGEGLSPLQAAMQVTLDQAAHFMDAVAIGTEPGDGYLRATNSLPCTLKGATRS